MHILIVRVHPYDKGRELIGSAEIELQRTIGRRTKMRLEGKGRRDI